MAAAAPNGKKPGPGRLKLVKPRRWDSMAKYDAKTNQKPTMIVSFFTAVAN
jgi:hypothetical protein